MKKLFLLAAMAVASLTANAQGWVGGALGYDYDDGNVNQNAITISPEVGYNLSDKWAIALDIDFGVRFGDGNTTTSFALTPYARYTFAKTGVASFFVDGGFNIGTEKTKGVPSQTTWGIGFQPGVAIALSEKVCLVSKIGYLGYQHHEGGRNQFGLGVNNQLVTFGAYYSF